MLRIFQNHTPVLALVLLGGPGLSGHPQQQSDVGQAPEFWLLLLLIVIFLAILAWWALTRRPASAAGTAAERHEAPVEAAAPAQPVETARPTPAKAERDLAAPPPAEPEPAPVEPEPAAAASEPAPAAAEPTPTEPIAAVPAPAEPAAAPAEPDDLRRIEGIGPKVEGALHALGVLTFAQLATADPAALEEQIRASGVRVLPGAPQTWPEQAALAAKGDWEGFEKLTAELKGGRRNK